MPGLAACHAYTHQHPHPDAYPHGNRVCYPHHPHLFFADLYLLLHPDSRAIRYSHLYVAGNPDFHKHSYAHRLHP
jgi:hypothetical protein